MNEEMDDEKSFEQLGALLGYAHELPPGLIARLDAGVSRAARYRSAMPFQVRLVVLCLAFSIVGMASPIAGFGPSAALVLTIVGLLYVFSPYAVATETNPA